MGELISDSPEPELTGTDSNESLNTSPHSGKTTSPILDQSRAITVGSTDDDTSERVMSPDSPSQNLNSGKKWSPQSINKVVDRFNDGQTLLQIALAMGRSKPSIMGVITRQRQNGRDIPFRMKNWTNQPTIVYLTDLTNRSKNAQIGHIFGTTEGAVKSALHRLKEKGVIFPPRQVDSEKLLEMIVADVPVETAAQEFHVSVERIKWYRNRFIDEGLLPQFDKKLRNQLIAELSESGLTAKEIVEEFKIRFPELKSTLKIVENIRANLIQQGLISRHPKGKQRS